MNISIYDVSEYYSMKSIHWIPCLDQYFWKPKEIKKPFLVLWYYLSIFLQFKKYVAINPHYESSRISLTHKTHRCHLQFWFELALHAYNHRLNTRLSREMIEHCISFTVSNMIDYMEEWDGAFQQLRYDLTSIEHLRFSRQHGSRAELSRVRL